MTVKTDFLSKHVPKQDRPGIIFVAVLGTVMHFLYSWTDENGLAALFSPVNESIWEHLKLLFFPYLVWSIADAVRRPRSFLPRQLYYRFLGVICGMLTIVTAFYTYTGVIGKHLLVLDILIYLTGVATAFFLPPILAKRHVCAPSSSLVYSLWGAVLLCFFLFTGFPPDLPLFFSPALCIR